MGTEKRTCDGCRLSFEEDWPRDKTALCCGETGKYHGRATVIFPTGHRGVAYGYPAPAWCTQYQSSEVR